MRTLQYQHSLVFLATEQLFSFNSFTVFSAPFPVYFRLSASFGSLCHRFTFYLCLILAVTFAAYPPIIASLQPRWQGNYSYLRFNCPCSPGTAVEF